MTGISWIAWAGIVVLFLAGAFTIVGTMVAALENAVEKLKRPRAESIGDILVASDISAALEIFEEERADAQCVVVLWVGTDGHLRLLHAGLADLEVGGLLQLALRRES
jgi:hypothetical protein